MKTTKMRFLSIVLTLVMLIGTVPMAVTAADGDPCAGDGCTGTYTNGFCSADSTHYEEAQQVSETHHPELNGTHSGYYAIENAGQLYWFAEFVSSGENGTKSGSNYRVAVNAVLTDDITVNKGVLLENGELNTADSANFISWKPIGYDKTPDGLYAVFTGIFDGNNKTISGLYAKYPTDISTWAKYIGLISYFTYGFVKNVTVDDSYFSGYEWVGGIVGYSNVGGTIENCVNKATVYGVQRIGGIAGGGENAAYYTNCRNEGIVQAGNQAGGIAGQVSYASKITGCSNSGDIVWNTKSHGSFGGLIGFISYSGAKVTNCSNTGDIIINGSRYFSYDAFGGLIGYANNKITVENSYSTGKISVSKILDSDYIGNFIGRNPDSNNSTITNCYYDNTDDTYKAVNEADRAGVTGKPTSAFESGEVAYLLQGTQTTQVWGQNIDNGEPVQTVPVLGSAKVYQVTNCKMELVYSNIEINDGEHIYGEPVYTWAEDYSSMTVTLSCTICTEETEGHTLTGSTTEITADTTNPVKTLYTATVTLNGVAYTDTKKVVDTDAVSEKNRVRATSLTISDSLAVNYKITVDPAYKIVGMEFTFGGVTTTVTDYTVEESTGILVFKYDNIAPHMMAETITSVVIVTDSDGEEIRCNPAEYSIAAYANKKITTAGLTELLASMVNYGDAAVAYTGNVYTAPSTKITNWSDYTDDIAAARDYTSIQKIGTELAEPAVTFGSASLILSDSVDIKIKLNEELGEGYYAKTFYGEEFTFDVVTEDGVSYFIWDVYNAAQMSNACAVTFTVYDAQGNAVSNSLTYSVESYVADMKGQDESLDTLLCAMMQYGDAALAYKKAANG